LVPLTDECTQLMKNIAKSIVTAKRDLIQTRAPRTRAGQ
jgi:hypothetical protein